MTLARVLIALSLLCMAGARGVVLWHLAGRSRGGTVSMLNACGILTFVAVLAQLSAALCRGCAN